MHQRRTGRDVLIDDILHYRNGRQFPRSRQDVGHLLLQPIGRKIEGCFPSPLASALSRRLAQTHNTTSFNQLPQIFRLQLQRTTLREWEWHWMHYSFSPRGEDWNDWRLTSQWAPSPAHDYWWVAENVFQHINSVLGRLEWTDINLVAIWGLKRLTRPL